MMEDKVVRRAFGLFAEALEYPGRDLAARVGECTALVAGASPEAAERLERFRAFVEETPPARLEEVYTGTFDLQVICYPYVGYQLFGESYKRGAFMAGLRAQYRASGFSEGSELPDHLAVLLRFMAILEDAEMVQELATLCIMPALDKMSVAFKDNDQPYGDVMVALFLFLKALYPGFASAGPAGADIFRANGGPLAGDMCHPNGGEAGAFQCGAGACASGVGSTGGPAGLESPAYPVAHEPTYPVLREPVSYGLDSRPVPGPGPSDPVPWEADGRPFPGPGLATKPVSHAADNMPFPWPAGPATQQSAIKHNQAPSGTGDPGSGPGQYQRRED